MSDSLKLHGLLPARLLCPWNFPGENTRVGCHSLLQGNFLTHRWNPCFLCLLHWQVNPLTLCHLGSPPIILLNITFIKSDLAQNVAINTEWLQHWKKWTLECFPGGSVGKESTYNAGDLGLIPGSRKGQPPLVFSPGKFHGQRNLVGHSPWGGREPDTDEAHTHGLAYSKHPI